MTTQLRRHTAWCALLALGLAACGHGSDHAHPDESHAEDEQEHAHPAGATSVTLWTDNTELFMEYPDLVVGQEARFLIHLTDLSDFSAVTRGALVCNFESSGTSFEVTAAGPARPGIYIPTVRFERPGVYTLELLLDGPQVHDRIHVQKVRVVATHDDLAHSDEGEETGAISFLKEQQWQIDFATMAVAERPLVASVSALGEILAGPRNHADVPALVHGVIAADQNRNLPLPGTWVEAGEVLAVISPPAETGSMLMSVRNEFLLAQSEYERAGRLYKSQAAPQRRLDEARLRYETSKATFDRVARDVDFTANDGAVHYHVTSPIAGGVVEAQVHLGQSVSPGDVLFSVTDPRRVLLEARVPLSHYRKVGRVLDASFVVEGDDANYRVSDLDGRVVSIGSTIDPVSRTLPVLFEIANPDLRLKIHQFVEVALHTGDTIVGLAVPVTALLDEGGQSVVYVQAEGESFVRRTVKTGIRDSGFVQVLDGLAVGEHVVTVGGYQVRLASLGTPTAGHGHAH